MLRAESDNNWLFFEQYSFWLYYKAEVQGS